MVPFSESLGAATEEYFDRGWVEQDLRYRGIPKLLKTGIVCDLDFMTQDEIKRSPYYQEFLGREGLRWFAGVKIMAGEDAWCLSIQRSIDQGPFSKEELESLATLSAPLSSAATTARALGYARAEGALGAFEFSDLGAILFDRFGKVLRVNGAAERLLGEDFSILRGRIKSSDPDATRQLDRALHAMQPAKGQPALMPPVLLPRQGSRRPLIAFATRLAEVSQNLFAPCQTILVIYDLNARPQPAEATLRHCFGLSGAEARLASALAVGNTLDDAAEELRITKETARHELKSVFAKLNVHRQSQLVALLARLLRA
jgi:DNA-binding CsgD family transcriptional regulator/PAS domain-containing protein